MPRGPSVELGVCVARTWAGEGEEREREVFIAVRNRAPVREATRSRTVLGGGNSNAPNDIQEVSAVLDYRVDVLYAQLCFLANSLNGMTAIQQPDQPTQP